ncbi:HTH-type transcriptional regulator DmlR [Defluviimonas aquaemixtae]|uniref:HTH-type transcriptional regulator DmlR n=1 Tax=Albidovulum aquaemixtae TaxID=1542388 RepID=A0A2R8B242_9RHOB|nr:LysR family transcriptional regulator [Defluviimonas aquaemixtae]SPH16643.1 HTH-type transcriptional regulator DmlR [Defluviimonas aquaemixtae]
MENWDEIRTAYQVARIGTVSGAAEVLGVHHATVIRHIDALEGRLGAKLFQRHARGYTATEAGQELLKVAQATEDQFAHLAARITGAATEVSGELVVTSLPGLADLLTPTLVRLAAAYPELRVRYVSDARLFRLEYGEAHVAIRAGGRPQEPDNVVQSFCTQKFGLYASQGYVDRNGLPESEEDVARHRFVGPADPESRAPFYRWLTQRVPAEAIIYRSNEGEALRHAVLEGAGLGFVALHLAAREPTLVEALPRRSEWDSALWLVTHVDLHRTPRIQLFLKALKDDMRDCGMC